MKTLVSTSLTIIFLMSFGITNAQEYDDLYFSAKDRKEIKYATTPGVNESLKTYQSYTNNNYNSAYSAKQVNPELIAKYKQNSRASVQEEIRDYEGYVNPSYSSDAYYDENFDEPLYNRDIDNVNGQTVINNFNGVNPMWSNTRFRVGTMMGFNPWGGWNTGLNIGFNIGFGNMWNAPFWNMGWGSPFYDPWLDPFWGMGWADPWVWRPGWTYGRGFWGLNNWGWNRWNRWNRWNNGWAYNNGFYDGLWFNNNINRRNVVRGARGNTRGIYYGDVYRNGRYRSSQITSRMERRNAVSSASRVDNMGNANARTRDYTQTQNEYYQRSRRGYTNNDGRNVNSRNAVTTPNGTSRTGATDVRSNTRTRSTYSRDYNRSDVSRSRTVQPDDRSSTRRYTTPQRNDVNRTYSRPDRSSRSNSNWFDRGSSNSNTRSRSYTPSRSGGSRSSGYSPSRSYGGSRSSGGGSGGSSRSRRGGN